MKFVTIKGASCLIIEAICDCRGKGLFIGGVGGAWLRVKGSAKGIDFVIGVPLYEEEDEV